MRQFTDLSKGTHLREPLIIVPFCRDEHLIQPFIEGLIDDLESLQSSNAQIFLICDSPDICLRVSLEKLKLTLVQLGLKVELIISDKNEGFICSANKGLKEAVACKMDVLLLSPRTILTSNVLSELRAACETDSMIAFVSPRSNKDGISAVASERQENCSLLEGRQIHAKISKHLPRFRYVPKVEKFCLYIRYSILVEFGFLNEIDQFRNSEEFDLIMTANRAGYRAVLANHAYVNYFNSLNSDGNNLSFGFVSSEPTSDKFPEYHRMAYEYYNSAEFIEESVRSRRINSNNSTSLLFDLSNIGIYLDGTVQHAVNIIKALPRVLNSTFKNLTIYVSIDEKSANFHGIDQLKNIHIIPLNTISSFDAVVRIGQPWQKDDLIRLANLAPVNAVFMEDTIAWDCGYIRSLHLDDIWKIALKTLNGILYSSEFTRNQFFQRFGIDGRACLLSTEPTEYKVLLEETNEKHLLIIGNHYLHKAIPETVKLLSGFFPARKIIVLGTCSLNRHNVQVIPSGHLSNDFVHRLYKDASEIIFPSHYEGFGFPVIQALAYEKKIFARRTPLLLEIATFSSRPDLIIPFDVLNELPHLINSPKPLVMIPGIPRTWTDHVSEILQYVLELCSAPDVDTRFRERLSFLCSMQSMSRVKALEEEMERIFQSRSWKVVSKLKKGMDFIRNLKVIF